MLAQRDHRSRSVRTRAFVYPVPVESDSRVTLPTSPTVPSGPRSIEDVEREMQRP